MLLKKLWNLNPMILQKYENCPTLAILHGRAPKRYPSGVALKDNSHLIVSHP
jgi:hypothetical protein